MPEQERVAGAFYRCGKVGEAEEGESLEKPWGMRLGRLARARLWKIWPQGLIGQREVSRAAHRNVDLRLPVLVEKDLSS